MPRKKLIWILIGVALLDTIIPIPFLAIYAIYIVVKRPVDFLDLVRNLYAQR